MQELLSGPCYAQYGMGIPSCKYLDSSDRHVFRCCCVFLCEQMCYPQIGYHSLSMQFIEIAVLHPKPQRFFLL